MFLRLKYTLRPDSPEQNNSYRFCPVYACRVHKGPISNPNRVSAQTFVRELTGSFLKYMETLNQ